MGRPAIIPITAALPVVIPVMNGCAVVSSSSRPPVAPMHVNSTKTENFLQGEAVVRGIDGEVFRGRADWKRVRAGDRISAGENLWCGNGAAVELFLGDNGPDLRI